MARDKEETKARILAAVGKLLAESGFRQLGINAIAREAQVDKVLIYRYFGNLQTLLQVFGKEGNYWISTDELIGDADTAAEDSLSDWMVKFLIQFLQDLQKRPITQEILRWELLEGNQLTQELAKVREQTAIDCLDFLKQTGSYPPDKDIPAMSAILIAGIVYLVLRSKIHPSFLGVDLTSPEGWSRIEYALTSMVRATLEDKQ
jgi:AcrR family transcriptional regulator